jgi:hypothetical protein
MTSECCRGWGGKSQSRLLKTLHALVLLLVPALSLVAQPKPEAKATSPQMVVVAFEGRLEFSRVGSQQWDPSYTNQVLAAGDRLRTGERSRALVRFGKTAIRLGELSHLAVPEETQERPIIRLFKGLVPQLCAPVVISAAAPCFSGQDRGALRRRLRKGVGRSCNRH